MYTRKRACVRVAEQSARRFVSVFRNGRVVVTDNDDADDDDLIHVCAHTRIFGDMGIVVGVAFSCIPDFGMWEK